MTKNGVVIIERAAKFFTNQPEKYMAQRRCNKPDEGGNPLPAIPAQEGRAHFALRLFNVHYIPPAVTAPIAIKLKIATSWQKWMNQAQKKPRVSNIALPNIQPRKVDMITPMTPYGTP